MPANTKVEKLLNMFNDPVLKQWHTAGVEEAIRALESQAEPLPSLQPHDPTSKGASAAPCHRIAGAMPAASLVLGSRALLGNQGGSTSAPAVRCSTS
eukprot:SAG22_NODE_1154_length_5343_cov_15.970633_2_plen_97_part_00